ncbi:MAG: asparagine--tRNA ligase [Acidobacteria bacterium]|nr:asparagine--tRNA ligase [Acidobacteriota bacterium]
MEQVYIEDIASKEGVEVLIKGWLYNKRSSGKIHFVLVRDGTGIIQGVVSKADATPEAFDLVEELTQESAIMVSGTVRKDARAPGGYELLVKDIKLVHLAEPYPITPKSHGIPFLMDHRHLWLRSRRQQAILRIRHEIIRACRDYYDSRGFVLIDAPILTPTSCEGTTTLFETDYFGEKVYLTQSGQLYLEPAAMAFGKVYCFGPAFRAEKSKTRRHLIEFWIVEPEVAYATLSDIMDLAEDFICYIVERVLTERRRELEFLERDISKLENIKKPFPRVTYDEAVAILKEKGVDFPLEDDFGAPEETLLSEHFDKPVMIHRYPTKVKAFYMEPDPEREDRVLCVDVLAPEGYGEIIGGGQRIHSYDLLLQRIKEHNLPEEAFRWYLDIRKYGSVPHSGFGLGIERTVAWLCHLPHVRETIPYPRMLNRLYP